MDRKGIKGRGFTPCAAFFLFLLPVLSWSQTATATSTATRTNTPTSTLTATGSPFITPTRTNTPTLTPTFPVTLTPTRTNTATQTFTGSPTPLITATFTRTPTRTDTPLPPPATFTSTATPTLTFTGTPGSPTATWTATSTPTITGTPTTTPTYGPGAVYNNAITTVSGAIGCTTTFVVQVRTKYLDAETSYILMLISTYCGGCSVDDLMNLRRTMGWDQVCANYGIDWATFVTDLRTRTAGLTPEVDTINQTLRAAANDPDAFPIEYPAGPMPDNTTPGGKVPEGCGTCN